MPGTCSSYNSAQGLLPGGRCTKIAVVNEISQIFETHRSRKPGRNAKRPWALWGTGTQRKCAPDPCPPPTNCPSIHGHHTFRGVAWPVVGAGPVQRPREGLGPGPADFHWVSGFQLPPPPPPVALPHRPRPPRHRRPTRLPSQSPCTSVSLGFELGGFQAPQPWRQQPPSLQPDLARSKRFNENALQWCMVCVCGR